MTRILRYITYGTVSFFLGFLVGAGFNWLFA